MGGRAEDMQAGTQLELVNLRVWQFLTEAVPGDTSVGGSVDSVIRPDVKSAAITTDLERPHRFEGKLAADVRPGNPAIGRAEYRARRVKRIDNGVSDLGIVRVNLQVIDGRVARNRTLRPGCATVTTHKDVAACFGKDDGVVASGKGNSYGVDVEP